MEKSGSNPDLQSSQRTISKARIQKMTAVQVLTFGEDLREVCTTAAHTPQARAAIVTATLFRKKVCPETDKTSRMKA